MVGRFGSGGMKWRVMACHGVSLARPNALARLAFPPEMSGLACAA
jgi:hypothetical protein